MPTTTHQTIAALLLLLAPPLLAETPQRVVVLDLKVEGDANPAVGTQLTARVAELIARRPEVSVVAPDEVRAMLANEANKQRAGCGEASCLAEIAGALGAELLVSGSVGKIGDAWSVSLSAIDAKQVRTVNRVSATWRGESIALLELAEPLIVRLLADEHEPLTGSLELSGLASGSRILIDGQVRGTAPAGQLGDIPIGSHRLQISAEGYQAIDQDFIVRQGQITSLALQQQASETPFYASWWFWGLAGAAAVGTAAAVTAAVVLLDRPGAGETGVNISVNAGDAVSGGR
ncbi:MAG: PEGA domain-containing protein [Deltaproteobacteria bacterium]|nr:PEGA domain-containing protein [Deltaproteobacteria bacterium]